jgi:hypothetical protein
VGAGKTGAPGARSGGDGPDGRRRGDSVKETQLVTLMMTAFVVRSRRTPAITKAKLQNTIEHTQGIPTCLFRGYYRLSPIQRKKTRTKFTLHGPTEIHTRSRRGTR